ncbi:MAG: integrase [Deltaproteobacteria bacterium]|nr:MAG: integrase [Deltaproteobacteria bacterium]
MDPLAQFLFLFVVGVIAGTLNILAGGGSFITLPVLIFLGLPASAANATNRISIVLQNASALWGFERRKVIPWRETIFDAALPACAGSIIGALVAMRVEDAAFKKFLAVAMVVLSLWTLLGKGREEELMRRIPVWGTRVGFFFIGLYSGFVQAGVGFFVLTLTTLGGLTLVTGNAVKIVVLLATNVLALAIFQSGGVVHWELGLSLASGSMIGGQIGVRLAVLKGHAWLRWIVTAAIVLFAVKLWLN